MDAFVSGTANMVSQIGVPRAIATAVMGVFIASFAGTTLDTAIRLQRYVIQELSSGFKFKINGYWATLIAVVTAAFLAFSGDFTISKLTAEGTRTLAEGLKTIQFTGSGAMKLWPMFRAVNQALAALSLVVVTLYLRGKGKFKFLITLLPTLFMVTMTLWALVYNEFNFIKEGNILIIVVNGIVFFVVWMVIEAGIKLVETFKIKK